jgi:1-acyl-sn-glycerol-3-phosphate acyltransferase
VPRPSLTIVLRSLLANVAFYVVVTGWMIALIPTFVLPRRRFFLAGAKAWGRFNMRLLHWLVGTRTEIRGLELIPPGGLLVASKHQSLFETFALLTIFDDPAYVLKRELRWIPLFGWLTMKAEQIPVDRGGGSAALSALNKRVGEETQRGRQIIIFPEGTRRPPGAPPAYKYGIVHLYESVAVPCLPVALNSGVHWPRRSFLRWPGTIVIEILPPLPKGLPRDQILPTLQERIETATNRLVAASQRELGFAVTATTPSARRV